MDAAWPRAHDRPWPRRTLSPSNSVESCLNQLNNVRRSLSRSPSKMTFSSCARSPRSPPRQTAPASLSPSLKTTPKWLPIKHSDGPASRSDHSVTPRPQLKRSSPLAQLAHSNTPARNPMRRALSTTSNNGNATPQSSQNGADGQENRPTGTQDHNENSTPLRYKLDHPTRSRPAQWNPPKSSPLKRTDGAMNLNNRSQAYKRRTFHAFDSFKVHQAEDDMHSDDDDTSPPDSPFPSPKPIQHGLFGQSTLHPEVIGRARRSLDSASDSPKKPKTLKGRSRLFNDSHRRSFHRDAGAGLTIDTAVTFPNDGETFALKSDRSTGFSFSRPHRPMHPLANTVSPNSPAFPAANKSLFQSSHFVYDESMAPTGFAKSLPVGAHPPNARLFERQFEPSQESIPDNFATPDARRSIAPNPMAFMSTGLISKKTRNVDNLPPPQAVPQMPDTPCKKGAAVFSFGPSPSPPKQIAFEKRFQQPSFGTPSRPYSSHGSRTSSGSFSQSRNIFGTNITTNSTSQPQACVDIDIDDKLYSPTRYDSQSSADDPPTPTKAALAIGGKENSLRSTIFGRSRRAPLEPMTFEPPESPEHQPSAHVGLSHSSTSKSPSTELVTNRNESPIGSPRQPKPRITSFEQALSPSSHYVAKTRLLRHSRRLDAPSPLFERSLRTSFPRPHTNAPTKSSPLSPDMPPPSCASVDRMMPQTPIEGNFPDPSGLSISPGQKFSDSSPTFQLSFGKGGAVPETPTHRDGHMAAHPMLALVTPSTHAQKHEVDTKLYQRFSRVEWYGKGEFSEVYKVFQPNENAVKGSFFSPRSSSKSGETPRPDRVFVVKKNNKQWTTPAQRARLLREGEIMRDLGKSDHVVQFIDMWEMHKHLYIQTEFCEEGTLEKFLEAEGANGRLEDFRIWKMLLDISEGLKHIHDSGYIHLDLKPANIFIEFSGILKIGDFGLATKWPLPPGTEIEGDRRYMPPDSLNGQAGKPSDIFALGMIIFEIASNTNLPDNGRSWQNLRSGNWSDLPSLTSGSSNSILGDSRDTTKTSRELPSLSDCISHESLYDRKMSDDFNFSGGLGSPNQWPLSLRRQSEELVRPPQFMVDPAHPDALDQIVHWMMAPHPHLRPDIDTVLGFHGCAWVAARRRSGATVYEGPWGPAPLPEHEVDAEDSEMLDVN